MKAAMKILKLLCIVKETDEDTMKQTYMWKEIHEVVIEVVTEVETG